jgi:hypothetical protein
MFRQRLHQFIPWEIYLFFFDNAILYFLFHSRTEYLKSVLKHVPLDELKSYYQFVSHSISLNHHSRFLQVLENLLCPVNFSLSLINDCGSNFTSIFWFAQSFVSFTDILSSFFAVFVNLVLIEHWLLNYKSSLDSILCINIRSHKILHTKH